MVAVDWDSCAGCDGSIWYLTVQVHSPAIWVSIACDAVEVDAARQAPTAVVLAVPFQARGPRRQCSFGEDTDPAALQVEDRDPEPRRHAQVEGHTRVAAEGIGPRGQHPQRLQVA